MRRRRQTDPCTAFATWGAVLLLWVLLPYPAHGRPAGEPGLATVSSHLRGAYTLAPQRVPPDGAAAEDPVLHWRDGRLEIEIRFRSLTLPTVEAIRGLGARIEHVSFRYARVVADADAASLAALAALPGVTAIHPNYGAQRSTGAVPGQADTVLRSDVARARFGVDGTGSRVGLLSDSFNRRIRGSIDGNGCARQLTGSSAQFSRDLPDTVVVLDDGPLGAQDEGAALGEIVHDIAPGAALLFASAYPSEAAFAENIDRLVACGADLVVDDVLFFAEPMFQDGIVAQAAEAAVAGGAAFFSAAGNHGTSGVDQTFRDAVPDADDTADPPSGDDLHDFGAGNAFAAATLPPGCGIRFVLQWDEPFSGTLGSGASTDLDLYVLDGASLDARVLASGLDTQGCAAGDGAQSGDPLEIALYVNNTGAHQTVYAAVDHLCGREEVRFRIATFEPNLVSCRASDDYALDPDIFDAAEIYGHPAAAGVATVAAVFFGEIESGGSVVPPEGVIDVNPYSARGGEIPIAFDARGEPLPGGPARRFKPEFAAPDGVNSTFFGIDTDYDDDTFRNFAGTSAAAPHAAAVAALMRQMDPAIAPAALVDVLRSTALDIGAPGRDFLAGDGLIDADAALRAVARPGDCDGDQRVMIDELIVAVRIALDELPAAACAAADRNGNGHVAIDELVSAVTAALAS